MEKQNTGLINRVVFIISIFGLMSIFGCSQSTKDVQYREISITDYKDKVAGGWLGQATGVLYAQDTEFKWVGSIVPFDLDDWYRIKQDAKNAVRAIEDRGERRKRMSEIAADKNNWEKYTPVEMSNQDDLYIEFLFLHSIQTHGLDVSGIEMAKDWLSYLDSTRIWAANKAAYRNFLKDIWPPMSGHPDNSRFPYAIDFQIEADLFGLISPGLPQSSNAWSDKVGHIMNYGYGVHAGMAISAMYGEAFFESDVRKLVEYSLQVIPPESEYAKMVKDVIAAHDKYPNWQDAWKELEEKWVKPSAIDVLINGAYVYMGLLYGNGDFLKTMNISMRCGRDSDCNPSNAVGILGTALGMKGTPEKWSLLRDLPIDNTSGDDNKATLREIYPDVISWNAILDATVEVGKKNIIANGGKIEDGRIYIPVQKPTVPLLEKIPEQES